MNYKSHLDAKGGDNKDGVHAEETPQKVSNLGFCSYYSF